MLCRTAPEAAERPTEAGASRAARDGKDPEDRCVGKASTEAEPPAMDEKTSPDADGVSTYVSTCRM
jgi:hypothetical protein